MLTDKIINAFEVNAKFNEVLFSLMDLPSNEQIQETMLALLNILLGRGHIYEQWRENHYELSEYFASSHKLLIAEHLNIISDLINDQLLISSPIDNSALDQNTGVISAHHKLKDVYQQASKMLVGIKGKNKSLASVEHEIYKCINDFFHETVNHELVPAKKGELKEKLGDIMLKSQERINRFFIRKRIELVKPDQEKVYEHFEKLEISGEELTKKEKIIIALGTTQEEIVRILNKYHADVKVRKEFTKEIRDILMAGEDIRFEHLYDKPEFKDLKKTYELDNKIDEKINEYCTRQQVYRDYITYGIGQDLPLSLAAIKIFAKFNKLKINLWGKEGEEKKEELKDQDASGETIDLFITADSDRVFVLVPFNIKRKNDLTPYDMLDNEKVDNYFNQISVNETLTLHTSNYNNSLLAFGKAHDRFHQEYIELDNKSAKKYIAERLSDLKSRLDVNIDNTKLYSNFFTFLFNELNFYALIGSTVVARIPRVLKHAQAEYEIFNDRFSSQLSNNIRKIPYQIREHLDSKHTHRKTDAYLIERINSIKQAMDTQGSVFFMWSVSQIDYYIKSVKAKNFLDNTKNLFSLIDSLATYYSLTRHYWGDYKSLHEDAESWASDFHNLIIEHKLQERLNSGDVRTSHSRDIIKSYKNKLDTILFSKKKLLTVETVNEIKNLQLVLKNPNKTDLSALLLNYMYTSLYHMDVFHEPKDKAYQWILQIQLLLDMCKKMSLPQDMAHNKFINDLSVLLKNQVVEQRRDDKVLVYANLKMVEIIDLIFKHAATLKLAPYHPGQGQKFRENLFNHHMAIKSNIFKNNLDNSRKHLYDEIDLVYVKFLRQEFYCAPISNNFLDMQDKLINFFEQIKVQTYQSKDNYVVNKEQMIDFVKNKAEEFEKSAKELLDLYSVQCDAEGDFDDNYLKERTRRHTLFNELYDFISIAMLQSAAKNTNLMKTYRQRICIAFDSASENPSVIANLKTEYDRMANPESNNILKYFIDPATRALRKMNETPNAGAPREKKIAPVSIYLRHAIVHNLKLLLIEDLKTPDNYSNDHLDFLCGLLDSITLEIKLTVTAHKMNMFSLMDMSDLHAAQALFLDAHCPDHEKLNLFKQEIKNAATLLLGDERHKLAQAFENQLTHYIERKGKVINKLWMSQPASVTNIQAEKALINLLCALCELDRNNSSTILLNTLLSNIFIVPEPMEKINGKDVSRCYMLNELNQIFLSLHTYNKKGQTLLHKAIELNLPYIANNLIDLGLSVAFENSDNESSREYIIRLIKEDKRKISDPIVEVIKLGTHDMRGITRRDNFYIENSIRNAGVPIENVSFILDADGVVASYKAKDEDFYSWFINLLCYSDNPVESEEFLNDLTNTAVISTLEGFNAVSLREKAESILLSILSQPQGLFRKSGLAKRMQRFLRIYEGVLMQVPPKRPIENADSNQLREKLNQERAKKEQAEEETKKERAEKEKAEEETKKERTEKEKAEAVAKEKEEEAKKERTEKEKEKAEKEKALAAKEQLELVVKGLQEKLALSEGLMDKVLADSNNLIAVPSESRLIDSQEVDPKENPQSVVLPEYFNSNTNSMLYWHYLRGSSALPQDVTKFKNESEKLNGEVEEELGLKSFGY
jgi:hypothetical protein